MAKMTLLQMVQNILSAMDSDEVNSISDTVESQQVAEILKETYYDLFSSLSLPEKTGIIKVEGLGDLERPNYLRLPPNVLSIDWLKYKDSQDQRFYDIRFLPVEEFLDRVLAWTPTTENAVEVTDFSGVSFYVKNDQRPRYYTVLNDEYIVTDAYNSVYDATLQASKTFGYGEVEEVWENRDGFIPNLDNDLFPLFLSEAKSVCFITIKQTANQKEEQRSRRHRVHLQYRKWKDKRQRSEEFSGVNYAKR